MKPVAGVMDPAEIAARKPTPADAVPDVLKRQAERRASEKTADAGQAVMGGDVHHHAPAAVTIHVHPEKGHSSRDIAAMVHRKFNEASQAQYNDGNYVPCKHDQLGVG